MRNLKNQPKKIRAVNDENVINKAYLDTNLSKKEGEISYIEKNHNEYKLHNNKQPSKEVLFEGAVKTTIRILYNKGLFDYFDNADDVLKKYLPSIETNERRRPNLDELNDENNVIQWFCS